MYTLSLKTSCATVVKFERNDEYDSNIHALVRFLSRTGESGYSFVTAQHEGLIPAINRELVEMSRKRGKKIQLVEYEDPEDKDLSFVEQLRRAAPDADALVVTGLDQALRERPYFIDALNFSREAFHEIGKPILFWFTQESLALIGNRAVDFYTQRSMMTVEFEHTPEINAPAPELERRFRDEVYRSKEDYEALKTRVNLLKKQLAEAEEAGVPRRRIAQDIALPLAKTYSELDLHEEALGLLEQFKEDWEEGDARELYERGGILSGGNRQNEAIACLEKAQGLLEGGSDLGLWADVEVSLGALLKDIGQLDTALRHFEQNLLLRGKIIEQNLDGEDAKNEMGVALNHLGWMYKGQGKLAKALGFFEKELEIREALHAANPLSEDLKDSLATSYDSLGLMYKTQGKLDKALKFFEKYLELAEVLYAANPLSEKLKNNLAFSYDSLGMIYESQGKLAKSLEYYEKYRQIREDLQSTNPLSVSLKYYLGVSYSRLGWIYKTQGKLDKALEFYQKNLEIAEAHYAANPMSESSKNGLLNSHYRLGEIYEMQGKLDKALEFFEKGLEIARKLCATDSLSKKWKSKLAESYLRLSAINTRLGKWFKSIYWNWLGLISYWQLCLHTGCYRYKSYLIASFLVFVLSIIIPPPIPIIGFWIQNKIILLYKRLRYGPEKPTPPTTSES